MVRIMQHHKHLLTIKEASEWASNHLKRNISESNISYLIQYGKVRKYNGGNATLIDLYDLKKYYQSYHGKKETNWKKSLGDDLNWALSFDYLREKDTTKHVHRLHPYKGKFIPQLVQYFIDNHTDEFKKESYFKPGDILLDPFSGSGTTLVQACEMGLHSIGIDISQFNCMITDVKLNTYDFNSLSKEINRIQKALACYEYDNSITAFESELLQKLSEFNKISFPSPDFKYQVNNGYIDENTYSKEKEKDFLQIYNYLVKKYQVKLKQSNSDRFLDKWYCKNVRNEIDFVFNLIKEIKDIKNKKALAIILSRTIRSCRATTHSDLATLKEPQLTTYYCWKHKKICKPIYSIKYWFDRYAKDTFKRLYEFDQLRTPVQFVVLSGDSRTIDIFAETKKKNKDLYDLLKKQKIRGIFTSPPYVGQIDYHEQHAYAYDLFGFNRQDDLEIGPLFKGKGEEARRSYVDNISKVLTNCKKFLAADFDIFLVANDKYNLYPEIVRRSGMEIVHKYKRPVLNRTERDKSPYSEIIFHIKNR